MTPLNRQGAGVTEETPHGRRLLLLCLTALGVVYGDIGTSPLYAIRECFHGDYGIDPGPANVLGVLSLMFWSLMLIVSVKYLGFILRADNRGEGGVLALTALFRTHVGHKIWWQRALVALGIIGASLLYGDGMITPAISVLSAVEGTGIVTAALDPYIVPLTVVILLGLFFFQSRGTRKVGALFGPITIVWFAVIAVLGIASVIETPRILAALSPTYGAAFLLDNGRLGLLVLGAVFLVVTGSEALYADMGHFGLRPIRLTWFLLVLPALLCNYFGQGALLLRNPEQVYHPFYALAPGWLMIPLVILATTATVIASQAVISGSFSLTMQAVQLGYLPRLRIHHTSATEIGQVYIPQVNWILMITTIGLVLFFQSSSKLAAAYGVAVTATMIITSILFYFVARSRWHWPRFWTALLLLLFLVVETCFFSANIGKITHGAWFPLVIGGVVYIIMTTWQRGRAILVEKLYGGSSRLTEFLKQVTENQTVRVEGQAIYMAGRSDLTPPALVHNLKHNKVLHSRIAILTVAVEDIPRVSRDKKVHVEDLGNGFYQLIARYGFMEEPNIPHVLAMAEEQGLDFELPKVSFFLGRERVVQNRRPLMPMWRERIFSFLSRNAQGATDFFHIPPEQVVELGTQVEL